MSIPEFTGDMAEILTDLKQSVRLRGELIDAVVDEEMRSADITEDGAFAVWTREIVIPEVSVKGRTWRLNESVFVGDQGYAITDARTDDLTGDVALTVERKDVGNVI